MSDVKPRILCIDDEPQVLESIRLNLRRHFDVHVSSDGRQGMEVLLRDGPFAVVISDLRMPNMGGVEVLSEAARRSPYSVRMMLTGQADLPTAMAAINEGRIFRLLLKPCPPQNLIEAITVAVEHYRQQAEERALAHATLMGSVAALTGTLALSRPAALNRAKRIRDHAVELAAEMRMPDRSGIEVAALLSQLGAVALPPELARKVYEGHELTEREQQAADGVTLIAAKLIASLPRTEDVRRSLETLSVPASGTDTAQGRRLPTPAARLLRICMDFDMLVSSGLPPMDALCEMSVRDGVYDGDALGKFTQIRRAELSNMEIADVELDALAAGMMLGQELRLPTGHVLAPRGTRVTEDLIQQVRTLLAKSLGPTIKVMRRAASRAA